MKLTSSRLILALLGAAIFIPQARTQVTPDLTKTTDSTIWKIENRSAGVIKEGDRQGMRLDGRPDGGIAWLVGSNFASGTIEVDLRGCDTPGRSFLGIAFHGVDTATYDAVYFRPFNFRISDVGRRSHSVQYISQPNYSWERLRAENPGKYEGPITPPPNPNQWLHARIAVDGFAIRVYVNSSTSPSLEVGALNNRHSGLIGLWVGNNSFGDFANLTITANR